MEKVTSTADIVRERLDRHFARVEDLVGSLRAADTAQRQKAHTELRAFLAMNDAVDDRLLRPDGAGRDDEPGESGLADAVSALEALSSTSGPERDDRLERLTEAVHRHHRAQAAGLDAVARATSAEHLGEVHRVIDLVTEMELSDVTFDPAVPFEQTRAVARRELDAMLTQLR